jgi:hypothetical protein
MLGLVQWVAGTRMGRAVAKVGAIVVGVLFVLWRVFAAGKKSAFADMDKASLENLRNRSAKNEEIADLSAGSRRSELSKWMRDRR